MFAKVVWGLGGTLALVALGVGAIHWTKPKVVIGGPATDAPRVALDQVNHAAFAELLEKYVDERGLVAYGRWKATPADIETLDRYLASLGAADLQAPTYGNAEIAFWLNAYNALTLKGILREYPTSSIRNHTSLLAGYNLWTDLLLPVDGRTYSLDDMEHDVLRGRLREPRVHFAVVCAAKGCPPLRNRPYTTADLDNELADNARRFFARPENFRVDAKERVVYLSEIFDWYGQDFAPTKSEQLQRIQRWLPDANSLEWINEPDVTVKFLKYDWDLNDQDPRKP
jgi:hypothetical protein